MARSEHQKDCIHPTGLDHLKRRGQNGRCGVASYGLKHECRSEPGFVHFLELILGLEEELAVGNPKDLLCTWERSTAKERFLQHALPIRHAHKRLLVRISRDWPQS
jgi:hypothetical protein